MFGYKLKYPRWMVAILRRSRTWRHFGDTHHRALKFGGPNQVWRRKFSAFGAILYLERTRQSYIYVVNLNGFISFKNVIFSSNGLGGNKICGFLVTGQKWLKVSRGSAF